MTLDEAIDVFVGATANLMSQVHPCIADRKGSIWWYQDAEREGSNYRGEEYVTHGIDPSEVVSLATQQARGQFSICYIMPPGEDSRPVRKQFNALQYRLKKREPFFVHPLVDLPRTECLFQVGRITTLEEVARLSGTTPRPQILPRHLSEDPPTRVQYWARDGEWPIGWVRSVRAGQSTWCSNLFVKPKYRRKGVGRALMAALLADDRESGSVGSVLLSTRSGAMLYPKIGYEQIGELLLFGPTAR